VVSSAAQPSPPINTRKGWRAGSLRPRRNDFSLSGPSNLEFQTRRSAGKTDPLILFIAELQRSCAARLTMAFAPGGHQSRRIGLLGRKAIFTGGEVAVCLEWTNQTLSPPEPALWG